MSSKFLECLHIYIPRCPPLPSRTRAEKIPSQHASDPPRTHRRQSPPGQRSNPSAATEPNPTQKKLTNRTRLGSARTAEPRRKPGNLADSTDDRRNLADKNTPATPQKTPFFYLFCLFYQYFIYIVYE